MDYTAILTLAFQATADTLPQTLQTVFPAMFAANLLDAEGEAVLQALRKAAGVSIKALRADWKKFLATRTQQASPTVAPLPPDVEAEADRLLHDPALLYHAIETMRQLGVEGEAMNRGILYLALTSRLTADPSSVLIKGRSSSGKSHLVKCALAMMPPAEYHCLTAMSAKALAYAEDLDFQHKVLVIFEDEGLGEEAEYLMRTLLTEGRLEYLTVDKGPQGLKARRISQPGPTGLITTMTKAMTREDNETRAWSLYVDDSKEQTLRVVKRQANAATGDDTPPETAPWQALQGKLTPFEVVIPWAPNLQELLQVDTLPRDITRLRRDFPRLLTLVKVIALLYQQQRTYDAAGRLMATIDDYAMAYTLVAEPFARSVHGLSAQALAVSEAVQQLYDDKRTTQKTPHDEAYITVRDLAKALRWAKRTVHKWVEQAEAADLLDIRSAEKGKPLKLWPAEQKTPYMFSLLPEPTVVAAALNATITAVHPLTGAVLPPMHACTPAGGNATTPTTTRENGLNGVCTECVQCACPAPADGGSFEHTVTCPHAHSMHTPDTPPGNSGAKIAGSAGQGGVHAVTVDNISHNGAGVHAMRPRAHPKNATTLGVSKENGDLIPDRARVHGGEIHIPPAEGGAEMAEATPPVPAFEEFIASRLWCKTCQAATATEYNPPEILCRVCWEVTGYVTATNALPQTWEVEC
jgi:hypothetical protein